MLSSEWIDPQSAVSMGLAWRVAPEDEVVSQTEAAALHLSSRDPRSDQATKRLMNAGRAEVSRAAMAREVSELRALLPPSTPSADSPSAPRVSPLRLDG
jgi:enoyl-CoA hydratase/carnithine racemase